MAPRVVRVLAAVACGVSLVGALARSWAIASLERRPPEGWLDLVVTINGAPFFQTFGLSLGFWLSAVLALCVFAVAAVLAGRYIRTVAFAVAIGAVVGGWASNFLERVSTGGVVDYLAVGAGCVHLIANIPDIAVVAGMFGTAILVFGPRHWREPRSRTGARRRARAAAGSFAVASRCASPYRDDSGSYGAPSNTRCDPPRRSGSPPHDTHHDRANAVDCDHRSAR